MQLAWMRGILMMPARQNELLRRGKTSHGGGIRFDALRGFLGKDRLGMTGERGFAFLNVIPKEARGAD